MVNFLRFLLNGPIHCLKALANEKEVPAVVGCGDVGDVFGMAMTRNTVGDEIDSPSMAYLEDHPSY